MSKAIKNNKIADVLQVEVEVVAKYEKGKLSR